VRYVSDIETISGELAAMRAAVRQAQANASAADARAEQIAHRSAASGFTGIAAGMNRVRQAIGEIRRSLGGASASLDDGAQSLASAPRQMSPEETITALTPVHNLLEAVGSRAEATATQVDAAKQIVLTVLRGGQPGPMLAVLDSIKEVVGQLNQRGIAARQHVESAISRARQIGDEGN
jgi:hypothetical protein